MTETSTHRVVERGSKGSALWIESPGLVGIPDSLLTQTREAINAENQRFGWIKYDIWSF